MKYLRTAKIIAVAIGCSVVGFAHGASSRCTGHNCKTSWELRAPEPIQLTVKAKAGNNAEITIDASRSAEENFLGYVCACSGDKVTFQIAASDKDNHVCQGVVTGQVSNYIQNTNPVVRILDAANVEVGRTNLVSSQPGDVISRLWTGAWTIPSGTTGQWLYVHFDGMVSDKHCPSHVPSIDADVSLTPYVASLCVVKVDLNIWNGGSDLDNGQTTGSQGSQVADSDEYDVGAYLLVNWDDDDADGIMNADGTWMSLPVPDITENYVANEDNLAQLKPTIDPLPDTGNVELEVSGTDASRIILWTQNTKGTPITLTSGKKSWNLAISTEKTDFQDFMNNGYWIEGTNGGLAERGVTFTMRYSNSDGTEVCDDVCRATIVMINLANAVYRDNTKLGIQARGHAAIAYGFAGPTTKANLMDDNKFIIRHCPGKKYINPKSDTLTEVTSCPGAIKRGCYTNPNITYVQRLMILMAAKTLGINTVTYTWADLLAPVVLEPGDENKWDGKLNTVKYLRCDGIVELCYEINGVMVWGMKRSDDTTNYDVCTQTDQWTYDAVLREWTPTPNLMHDNMEEHNDMDVSYWADTLMPATQAGWVILDKANTTFNRQHLCVPVGSTGGNP